MELFKTLAGFPRSNCWPAGLVLALASALLRYWALEQTPYANGWDSYFYLVQLKSLEETGRMHSPEAALIYPYLRFFYWLTGDYVSALKSGTALLAGAFTATMYWAARRSERGPSASFGPWVLTAWSVYSPQLTYFAAQYPKNLLGLVLLLAFIGSLGRPVSGPAKTGRGWILPALLLATGYFGHRLTFALAVVYLIFWLAYKHQKALPRQMFSPKNLLIACFALVVFLGASRIFPGLFHFVDFGRLTGALHWPPQFAPYSFVAYFGEERISGWWLAELAVVVGCWLWVLCCRVSFLSDRFSAIRVRLGMAGTPISCMRPGGSSDPAMFPLLALCSLLLFPFLEWSFTGIAWRFFLVFVLLTPLLVIDFQFDKWRRSGLVFVVILLCCSLFSWKSYHPKKHDPDYARFEAVTKRSLSALDEKKADLVIAHNAMAEFFTFTTGIDAMPWLPEYAVDSSRQWRLATGMRLQTLKYYAGPGNDTRVMAVGFQYYLLPEYVWQVALQRAKFEKDEVFLAETADWRNPSQLRPGWLLRRKRTY